MSEIAKEQEVITIDGALPDGCQLARPLAVQIQSDGEEILVSEPHFYIHASGYSTQEALAEFKRVLVDELKELTLAERQLAPRLQKQLGYLRSIIVAC